MPDPQMPGFFEKFWAHILTALTGLGIIFRQKILDGLKALITMILKDHTAELARHEERDVERFSEVKETILGVRADLLDALRDNYKNIREDRIESDKRVDKRLEFLEKVFLDERLKR